MGKIIKQLRIVEVYLYNYIGMNVGMNDYNFVNL